jgi:antitoxin MazE
MRSALRKMGNSTGIIVPAPLLRAAGLSVGAELELIVEDGRIVATPVVKALRAGWAESAAALGVTAEEGEWLAAPLANDTEIEW